MTKELLIFVIGGAITAFLYLLNTIFSIKAGLKTARSPMDLLKDKLDGFILDAEKAGFSSGEAKLNHVLRMSIAYLSDLTGKTLDDVVKHYRTLIINEIESRLSTPQKKEGN